MRRAAPAALLAILAACEPAAPPPGAEGPLPPAPAATASAGKRRAPSGAAAGQPLLGPMNPSALEEIVAAAPSSRPPPTGEDGGTRIGTDTGVPSGEAQVREVGEPEPPRARVVFGDVTIVGRTSSPAIEKAARAQLYWVLVQRCRGPDGAILPPDSVHLAFEIDAEGYLIPSSIVSTAADTRFDEAAACMRRELSGVPFRMPPGARGQTAKIDATVPSID